jgi:hypothetical protein
MNAAALRQRAPPHARGIRVSLALRPGRRLRRLSPRVPQCRGPSFATEGQIAERIEVRGRIAASHLPPAKARVFPDGAGLAVRLIIDSTEGEGATVELVGAFSVGILATDAVALLIWLAIARGRRRRSLPH